MRSRVRQLSGLDALFLYLENSGTPMHTASLIRLECPTRSAEDFAAEVVEHLSARLAKLPILRRVLVQTPLSLGHGVWEERHNLDMRQHVVQRKLAKPGSDKQLLTLIGNLHAERMDRGRPLWQVVVISGLSSGEVALYQRAHHALVDGQAGVRVSAAILDIEPKAPEKTHAISDVPTPQPLPKDRLARAALKASAAQFGRMLLGMPEKVKRVAAQLRSTARVGRIRDSVFLAPKTPFNVNVEVSRRIAVASISMAEVKLIAKRHGVSLNDVVMATCSGALRAYLLKQKALPDKSLIAAMPISLREPGSDAGNDVSMAQCPLATDLADPLARLRAINATTAAIKGRVSAFKGLIPTDFPGVAAPIWVSGLGQLWKRGRLAERLPPLANVAISNVPGPQIPLYIAGARVRNFYPVSIINHGLGLNITLVSYAGSLEYGIVSSENTLNKPEQLASALHVAHGELLASVGL